MRQTNNIDITGERALQSVQSNEDGCIEVLDCSELTWFIIERDSTNIQIQLNVSDTDLISSGLLDTVVIRIIDPSKLISNENGLLVIAKDFKCNGINSQTCLTIP